MAHRSSVLPRVGTFSVSRQVSSTGPGTSTGSTSASASSTFTSAVYRPRHHDGLAGFGSNETSVPSLSSAGAGTSTGSTSASATSSSMSVGTISHGSREGSVPY